MHKTIRQFLVIFFYSGFTTKPTHSMITTTRTLNHLYIRIGKLFFMLSMFATIIIIFTIFSIIG